MGLKKSKPRRDELTPGQFVVASLWREAMEEEDVPFKDRLEALRRLGLCVLHAYSTLGERKRKVQHGKR